MAGEFVTLARGGVLFSPRLKKYVGAITDKAVALIESEDGPITLTTGNVPGESGNARVSEAGALVRVVSSRVVDLTDAEHTNLERICLSGPGRRWRGVALVTDRGGDERIALALDPGEDLRLTTAYLERVWPILREDCLREVNAGEMVGQGWNLLDRFDIAVLIVDGAGLMYRLNAAAHALIASGRVLVRGRGGVFAASDIDSRRFRAALRRVASGEGGDEVTFVTDRDGAVTHPVMLSRYSHDGVPTRFVVVTVPMPPDPERVEELALEMGLTGTEARVARLLQLGLSNREAADRSGLKEETFKTYAKRALAKLKVRGRAEMAQMLTWQAAGRRAP